MKCEYCGFNSSEESIRIEGAPCGYKGCLVFTCCMKSWKKHMLVYHKVDIDNCKRCSKCYSYDLISHEKEGFVEYWCAECNYTWSEIND